MLVIFTYLRGYCPCDVTTFLDLTSFRLLTGSGRVGSRVKNPGPVPSLTSRHVQLCLSFCRYTVNKGLCVFYTMKCAFYLKMHQNVFGDQAPPEPTALPGPSSWIKGRDGEDGKSGS